MVTNWQPQLTYGLSFLFELKTSRSYEHHRRLLQSKGLPRTPVALAIHLQRAVPPQFDHTFPWYASLVDAITWASWYQTSIDPWALGLTHEEELIIQWPGAHDDADTANSALFRFWLEVHEEVPATVLSFCPESEYFRKCGYVMWDMPVPLVMDLGFDPEELHNRIRDGKQRALIENIERQRGRDQMRRSWKERAAIREQGGRGYWESGQSTEDSLELTF